MKGTEWPSIMMRSVSPRVAGRSMSLSFTKRMKSLSTLILMSTGASLTDWAYSASAFFTVANSLMLTLQFFLMKPSMRRRPSPWSSG